MEECLGSYPQRCVLGHIAAGPAGPTDRRPPVLRGCTDTLVQHWLDVGDPCGDFLRNFIADRSLSYSGRLFMTQGRTAEGADQGCHRSRDHMPGGTAMRQPAEGRLHKLRLLLRGEVALIAHRHHCASQGESALCKRALCSRLA